MISMIEDVRLTYAFKVKVSGTGNLNTRPFNGPADAMEFMRIQGQSPNITEECTNDYSKIAEIFEIANQFADSIVGMDTRSNSLSEWFQVELRFKDAFEFLGFFNSLKGLNLKLTDV